MKEEDLKRLIEKYYKGESTEEDEKTLRDYFKGSDIHEGFETEKVIFSFYDNSMAIPEPSVDFESRILSQIDETENGSSIKIIRKLRPFMSAAAGIALLISAYFFFSGNDRQKDTFSDPQIAYAETIKILREVSDQLNKGSNALEPVGKMNEVTRKSFKTLNNSTKIVGANIKRIDILKNTIENKAHNK